MKRGTVGDRQSGGRLEGDLVRQLDQPVFAGDHQLARRAVAEIAHDPVARRHVFHTFADRLDHPGKFGRR